MSGWWHFIFNLVIRMWQESSDLMRWEKYAFVGGDYRNKKKDLIQISVLRHIVNRKLDLVLGNNLLPVILDYRSVRFNLILMSVGIFIYDWVCIILIRLVTNECIRNFGRNMHHLVSFNIGSTCKKCGSALDK